MDEGSQQIECLQLIYTPLFIIGVGCHLWSARVTTPVSVKKRRGYTTATAKKLSVIM
jgi:hypothetical protein